MKIIKGIVYAMTSNFNIVKIGMVKTPTIEVLEERRKSHSEGIDYFVVRRALRVDDVQSAEKRLHLIFKAYKKEKEFFHVPPPQVCAAFALLSNGKGEKDIADYIKQGLAKAKGRLRFDDDYERQWETMKLVSMPAEPDVTASHPLPMVVQGTSIIKPPSSAKGKRAPRRDANLYQIGIKEGDKLYHTRCTEECFEVTDPRKKKGRFRGRIVSLREASFTINQELGFTGDGASSKMVWTFEGETLAARRDRLFPR